MNNRASLSVVRADITMLRVDAIVNAASHSLLGGGGVDGAIHAAAGPGLLAECERLSEVEPGIRCRTGEARLTGGHLLPVRAVIHTVGPLWNDDAPLECDALLASCYRACVSLAAMHRLRSIAFPCISTGLNGFPQQRAAQVAVTSLRQALAASPGITEIRFVCNSHADTVAYQHLVRTT